MHLSYLSIMVTSVVSLSQISKNHRCTLSFRHQENQTNPFFNSCRPIELNGPTFDQITDWKACQEICCPRQGQSSAITFQQCLQPDVINKDSFDPLQLAFNFIISIVTLLIVLVSIYGIKLLYNYLIRKYGQKSRKKSRQLAQNTITKSIYSIIWISIFPIASNQVADQKNSEEVPKLSLHFGKSYCNLCKDINADIKANCGHSFHTECLHSWLQRRNSCPQCPNKRIYYTKQFCTRCYCQYFILDVDYYKRLGAIYLECNYCVTKEEMKDKIVRYYWIDGKHHPTQQSVNSSQVQ